MRNSLKAGLAALYALNLTFSPVSAETPVDAGSVPTLQDVSTSGNDVILDLSQLMPYDVFTLETPWRLVVEIQGTLYKTGFAKKAASGGLVRRIRGYQFKENPLISRVVLDLKAPVDYKTNTDGSKVILSLTRNQALANEPSKARKAKPAATGPKKRQVDLLASLPREEVTLDFEGADIRDVVRLMAETSNINIIFGPEVSGNISVHLKRVPFDEAFSTILNLKGLVASQLGANILRVTTPEILARERSKAVVYTKTIPVNYMKAEEMQRHLLSVISSAGRKGTITVAVESNSLVLTDSEEGIGQAQRLIAQLDKKPKQVMIEARIVEINLNHGFDIGVQWEYAQYGGDKNFDPLDPNFNFIGTNGEDSGRIAHSLARIDPLTGDETLSRDIGANVHPGGTGVALPGPVAAGITFGFVQSDKILAASLGALISQSRAKILSAPKVVTINGQAAKIEAVQDIRFRTSTVSNGVVTSDFRTVSAGIILNVTPTVNAEDRITLRVAPESSFPTQESTEAGPIIRTRTAQTTVIVKDGETLVIGGLIDDQDTKGVTKVPLLGDIPIIGTFFRSKTTRKIRNELLVFVTPRIIRD